MRRYILYLFAVTVMTSCSGDDQPEAYIPSQTEICVIGGAQVIAETRSVYNDVISSTNPLTARVLASLSPTDFMSGSSSLISGFTAEMTFTGQGATYTLPGSQQYATRFTSPVYYPINPATNVYITGFYPFSRWSNTTATQIGHPIDGNEDIMYAPMMSTNKNDALAIPTTYRNLAFAHRLTLLKVEVVGTDASSATTWGVLRALYLSKIQGATPNARLVVNLTNNAATYTGTIGTPSATPPMPFPAVNFYRPNSNAVFTGQSITLTTTPQEVAYTMIQPINIATFGANGYHIYIRTDNVLEGIEIPVSITNTGNTEGKNITILLTFGPAREIRAMATVTDWTTGTTGSGTATM